MAVKLNTLYWGFIYLLFALYKAYILGLDVYFIIICIKHNLAIDCNRFARLNSFQNCFRLCNQFYYLNRHRA